MLYFYLFSKYKFKTTLPISERYLITNYPEYRINKINNNNNNPSNSCRTNAIIYYSHLYLIYK